MQKYKVIALSVGGKGRKIYDSGDIVTADCFPDNNADELVKKGFLAPYVEPTPETQQAPPPANPNPQVPEPTTTVDAPEKPAENATEVAPEPEQTTEPEATEKATEKATEETNDVAETQTSGPTAEGIKPIGECTVAWLKEQLKELNIPFAANANKAELYKTWADLQK